MTGLEKIVQEIREEASSEAKALTAQAQAEREQILASAKAESDTQCRKIAAQAAQDIAEIERGCASALDLQRRQRMLDTKQQLLSETMDRALDALQNLPEGEYFPLLVRMAAKYAQPGEGILFFDKRDLQRLPPNFSQELKSALPTGVTITLSKETRPVDGGFVLKYGDVEENCSFRALFDTRRDELADKIVPILFS